MNTDTVLRETLREYRAAAPPSAGLLDAVLARSTRRRRRHRVAAAGTAAAALAAALAGSAVVQASLDGPATAPQTGVDTTDTLAPPSYELPPFPFTPGWEPEDLGDAEYLSTPTDMELIHYHPERTITYLSVRIHSDDLDHWFETVAFGTAREATTVRGQDAVLHTGRSDETVPDEVPSNEIAAVSWPYDSDQWVTVLGHNGYGVADVIRYAEELVDEPFPAQPAFTFEVLPVDAEPWLVGRSSMRFAPPGRDPSSWEEYASPEGLIFYLTREGSIAKDGCLSDLPLPPSEGSEECGWPEPIQVGEREGRLLNDDVVIVYLEDQLVLAVIDHSDVFSLSPEELIQVAAGVQLTEHAQVFKP